MNRTRYLCKAAPVSWSLATLSKSLQRWRRLIGHLQELGLAEYASERRAAPDNAAAADGKAWRSHFGVFFRLVLEHVSTLVEVRAYSPTGWV